MADYRSAVRRETAIGVDIDEGLRAYMSKVYSLMGVAMAITGVVAYVVGSDFAVVVDAIKEAQATGQYVEPATAIVPASLIESMFFTWFRWVLMLAPLGFVFLFAAAVHKMSTPMAQIVFWAFAAVMGVSISFIFAVYTGASIAQTFFVTAIAFLSLSLYGYTTKKDLSGWGTFLIMGVIGLIIASIVNIFLQSSALEFAVSALGVLIFAGLTAYDTQRLKNEYIHFSQMGREGAAILQKGAIMGALSLYLNFLNMFMFLLQFLGAARE